MASERQDTSHPVSSRTLPTAALANAILWMLSIIALIVVMQRSSSPKGLFIILAGGLAVALTIMSAVQRQRQNGAG